MNTSARALPGRGGRAQAEVELHHVVGCWRSDRRQSLSRGPGGPVDTAPLGQGRVRLCVLAGGPAAAFDEVAAASGEASQIVDVARAVAGGALGEALGMADVSLGHVLAPTWLNFTCNSCGLHRKGRHSGWE